MLIANACVFALRTICTLCVILIVAIAVPAVTFVYTSIRYKIGLWRRRDGHSKAQEPLQIPYKLPWLGNAIDFLSRRPGSFYTTLLQKHPRALGACSLMMGGDSIHIIFNPHAIQSLFRIRGATRDRLNADIITKVFDLHPSELPKYHGYRGEIDESTGKHPKAEEEALHDYLLKTSHVNELTAEYTRRLQSCLSTEMSSHGDKVIEVDLYRWSRTQMFRASTEAFFGKTFLRMMPNLEELFFSFEADCLTCYFGIPRFMAPKVYDDRQQLIAGLERCQHAMIQETNGKPVSPDGPTSWESVYGSRVNRARQMYYAKREISVRGRAIFDLGFMFGISSNAIPAAGWMLVHILDPKGDPSLYPRVLQEVLTARRSDGSLDIPILVNQPLLLSMFHEVLRMYVDTLVTRDVPWDLRLPLDQDGKQHILLKEGGVVMAPSWFGHRDETLWSDPGPHVFCPERFVSTDPQTGRQIFTTNGTAGKFFPFGGGKTICPGRVFAKQEVLGTVAILLLECEFEALTCVDLKGQVRDKFPDLKDAYPGSTVMQMDGDIRVRIKKRT